MDCTTEIFFRNPGERITSEADESHVESPSRVCLLEKETEKTNFWRECCDELYFRFP